MGQISKKTYNIIPCPAPRMTRADRWKKRPCVLRYFNFKDKVRELNIKVFNGDSITFIMPMPESWAKKKVGCLTGQPHTQTPDLDNLLKALLDSVYGQDKGIHTIAKLSKIWGAKGRIVIY